MTNTQILAELTAIDVHIKTIRSAMHKAFPTRHFHYAAVCWISPFGQMEYRVGWFEELFEAEQFLDAMKKQYTKLDFTAWGNLNGFGEWKHEGTQGER